MIRAPSLIFMTKDRKQSSSESEQLKQSVRGHTDLSREIIYTDSLFDTKALLLFQLGVRKSKNIHLPAFKNGVTGKAYFHSEGLQLCSDWFSVKD